ncbi:MAG TPA: tryptophan-rich sensory protein [Chlamydiales bacterium]|nr:tryptophan-rich sensory protein [Chlamydiales bacterium]
MSIDQSQPDSFSLPENRFFKPSHRTRPEQIVGLGIFLLISLGFELLNAKLIFPAEKSSGSIWTIYFVALSLSIWTLWRRHSLRTLKLEISLFSSQFLFQIAWSLSFYLLQETLLALVALLLLWCNHLMAALLFWKKEKISGQILLIPFLWIFYIMGLNMVICISNP